MFKNSSNKMHWLSPLFYMETKFVLLRRNSWYQWRWNFSGEQLDTHFSDHKGNDEISEELKVEPVDEKLRRYKSYWLWHITRTNNRMQK